MSDLPRQEPLDRIAASVESMERRYVQALDAQEAAQALALFLLAGWLAVMAARRLAPFLASLARLPEG